MLSFVCCILDELSLISSKKEHGIVADRESRNPLYLVRFVVRLKYFRQNCLEFGLLLQLKCSAGFYGFFSRNPWK